MTNLSSHSKKKIIITPENSLFFIPIISGLLILTSLLTFIYRPLIKKLANEESQIKVLQEKISYIPIYKKYIKDLTIITNKAKSQQERLIGIISDPEELNTILSEINRICIDNGIEIINIIPKPIQKASASINKNSNELANKNISTEDPFLIPTIEKHQFKITLKGEFNRLISFLKELELLQAIAISDNIEIKSNPTNNINKRINLTMSFSLSTYAKIDTKKINSLVIK